MEDITKYANLHTQTIKKRRGDRAKQRAQANKRALEIAKLRYDEELSYQAIADKYEITRQRVYQILQEFSKRNTTTV